MLRIQQPRHRFVRLHHEHLDQRMREALILRHCIDHLPIFIQHQIHLRQIQHELPLLLPALLKPLGQHIHVAQMLEHLRRVIRYLPRALGMRNLMRAID